MSTEDISKKDEPGACEKTPNALNIAELLQGGGNGSKMDENERKEKEMIKRIEKIKEKRENSEKMIEKQMDELIEKINKRKSELKERVREMTAEQIKDCKEYAEKVQEWSEYYKNAREKIIIQEKEAEIGIASEKYEQRQLGVEIEDDIALIFESKTIEQEIAKFGAVLDKKISSVQVQVKDTTENSVTLKAEEKEGGEGEAHVEIDEDIDDDERGKGGEQEIKEMEEKWNEIQVNTQMHPNQSQWEYSIIRLSDHTTYDFRVQARHSIFHTFSNFSDIVSCQTDSPCPLTLLHFSSDRICHAKDVILEEGNTLVRNNSPEDYGRISISFPLSDAVVQGTHCWRIKMCNSITNIGWVMLGVANAHKTFTNESYTETECWGYDGCSPSERNDSQKISNSSITWKWWMLNEYVVDMFLNMKTFVLKWKQVTEDGKGQEHTLTNNTTFAKYKNLSLVPHINFVRKHTTIQVMKIPSAMYGTQISRTSEGFR
ncbi:hypothetical protein RFI_23391 [Reticulomyxa filosa]|uniref:Fibronectin type-III domain-containing protein n=1 Tax=Reticulomyxa filosa TaxID=46433 RepID=X6MK00_RETFI|nr:hypothetical protein RFI_23391 [Reticulomyxa filosa]|eukprot:ETO13976.1 hypothetical protein RFI_23391 [Reticulomyxa filosa]